MKTSFRPSLNLAAMVAMAAASLVGVTPAQADISDGYGVATAGQSFDPYPFVRAAAAYRTGQDGSGNYTVMADVPSERLNTCASAVANGFTCTAALGGTNSDNYNLSSSTTTVTFTTSLTASDQSLLTSSVSSRANLATGQLGVDASTSYRHIALGTAQFNDTLTFNVAGATASTLTLITVGFTLDGSLFSTPGGIAVVRNALNFGAATADIRYQVEGDSALPGGLTSQRSEGGWVSFGWSASTPSLTRFTGTYALTGASTVLGIREYLQSDAGNQAQSLYGSTSAFNLSVPTGVTYSSASGVFLSAVPEPQTYALMLAGLVAIGAYGQRKACAGGSGSCGKVSC